MNEYYRKELKKEKKKDIKLGIFFIVIWFVVATVVLAIFLVSDYHSYKLAMEQEDENIYYQVEAVKNEDVEPEINYYEEKDEYGNTFIEHEYETYEYEFVGNDGNTHSLWLGKHDDEVSLYIRVDDPTEYSYPKSIDEIEENVENEIKIYLKALLIGCVLGAGLGITNYLGFIL